MKTSVIVLITPSICVVTEQEQSLLEYLCRKTPELARDDLKEVQNTRRVISKKDLAQLILGIGILQSTFADGRILIVQH